MRRRPARTNTHHTHTRHSFIRPSFFLLLLFTHCSFFIWKINIVNNLYIFQLPCEKPLLLVICILFLYHFSLLCSCSCAFALNVYHNNGHIILSCHCFCYHYAGILWSDRSTTLDGNSRMQSDFSENKNAFSNIDCDDGDNDNSTKIILLARNEMTRTGYYTHFQRDERAFSATQKQLPWLLSVRLLGDAENEQIFVILEIPCTHKIAITFTPRSHCSMRMYFSNFLHIFKSNTNPLPTPPPPPSPSSSNGSCLMARTYTYIVLYLIELSGDANRFCIGIVSISQNLYKMKKSTQESTTTHRILDGNRNDKQAKE